MPARTKRLTTAEDLYRLEQITDCRISPDGKHVVYAVQRVDKKTEKKYANLWIVPTRGGAPRSFTLGDHVDAQPRWSPDGEHIAFLSNRGDEKQMQIYVIPFGGGEARKLTDLKGSFGSFAWSPDGRQFVVQFRQKDREAVEREQDEEKKKLGVVARRITRVWHKLDGEGFLPDERWHIWTVHARTGRAKQVTDGEVHDEVDPCWSPDGKSIAFMSNRHPDPDFNPDEIDLFVIPATGGRQRKIDTPIGGKRMPVLSPDGKWIAYIGREGRGEWWKNDRITVVPANGKGKPVDLTGQYDFHVESGTLADTGAPPTVPPVWSSDSRTIYFQVTRHGSTELRSVSIDGGDLQTVIGDKGVVGAFSFGRDQDTLAYFFAEMNDPGQVWARDMANGRSRRLTAVNAWLRGTDLGELEEVWFKGAAGNRLQGWILKPPRFSARKKYPAIVEIHGGPLLQYGHHFMHEFHFLAANGYVVAFSNQRGGLRRSARQSAVAGVGHVRLRRHHGLGRHPRKAAVRRQKAHGCHGRQLRRVHDQLDHRPHQPFQGGRHPAQHQQPDQHVGNERLQLVLSGRDRGQAAVGKPGGLLGAVSIEVHRQREDAHTDLTQRARPALLDRAGRAALRRA
jgi:dipeptidyl aminopeptidase/acylaminoacyl peptidase